MKPFDRVFACPSDDWTTVTIVTYPSDDVEPDWDGDDEGKYKDVAK